MGRSWPAHQFRERLRPRGPTLARNPRTGAVASRSRNTMASWLDVSTTTGAGLPRSANVSATANPSPSEQPDVEQDDGGFERGREADGLHGAALPRRPPRSSSEVSRSRAARRNSAMVVHDQQRPRHVRDHPPVHRRMASGLARGTRTWAAPRGRRSGVEYDSEAGSTLIAIASPVVISVTMPGSWLRVEKSWAETVKLAHRLLPEPLGGAHPYERARERRDERPC